MPFTSPAIPERLSHLLQSSEMNPHGEFTVDGIVAAHLLEEDPIARRDHACEGRSPMLGRLRPRAQHFAVLGDETAGLLPFDSGLALARRGNGRLRHRLGNGLFQHLNGVGIRHRASLVHRRIPLPPLRP